MRRVALIGVVALLVIGVFVWLSQRWTSEQIVPKEASVTVEHEVESVVLAPSIVRDHRSEVTAGASVESTPGAVASPPARLHLHGTVVVLDENGVEHAAENGNLNISLWIDKSGHPTDVPVNGGAWELDVARCDEVSPNSAVLGGRAAFEPRGVFEHKKPVNGRVDFRFVWSRPLVVHARDAVTNIDLGQIEVVAIGIGGSDFWITPPGNSKIRFHGSSPLTIDAAELQRDVSAQWFYVRAPGYAWSHVRFSRKVGGDVFVEMFAGSSLDIEIAGSIDERAVLRLRPSEGAIPILAEPIGKRTQIVLEDLPPRQYVVQAQIGSGDSRSLTLAQADVQLLAHTRARVKLTLGAAPGAERATLSGVLRIPTAWNASQIILHAEPIDQKIESDRPPRSAVLGEKTTTVEFESVAWTIADILPGRYKLATSSPSYSIVVELLAGGTSNVLIDVPPPAQVVARVIDAGTGEAVPVRSITWRANPHDLEPRGLPTMVSVRRDELTGTYDFQCPVGEIELTTPPDKSTGYPRTSKKWTVQPGVNEIAFALEKGTGVVLSVKDGDEPVKMTASAGFEVVEVDGDGAASAWQSDGSAVVAFVTKSGRYRIRLKEPIPGFLMPAEQIVDLAPGTLTDVVIRLTRKP